MSNKYSNRVFLLNYGGQPRTTELCAVLSFGGIILGISTEHISFLIMHYCRGNVSHGRVQPALPKLPAQPLRHHIWSSASLLVIWPLLVKDSYCKMYGNYGTGKLAG